MAKEQPVMELGAEEAGEVSGRLPTPTGFNGGLD